jgi:NTE family protein
MEQRSNYRRTSASPGAQREGAARCLGLVLGGGGGKGGAHLGVISVIEAIGLPIDLIVGSSIGGVIGGLYAAGYSLDEIGQALSGVTLWRMFERDPSGMGLIGSRRMRAILEDMLGGCTFEQLDTPCAIVTTDLVTGDEIILDSGSLVEALLATMALPGIFPPLQRGRMLLADGGIANNLPVNIAYARGADKVIAVDLGGVCDDFQLPQGNGGPLNMLNLLPNQAVSIANRGLALLMAHLTRYRLADVSPELLLCHDVEQINSFDMSRLAEGRPVGEAVAHAAINDLIALRDWRAGEQRPLRPLARFPDSAKPERPLGPETRMIAEGVKNKEYPGLLRDA